MINNSRPERKIIITEDGSHTVSIPEMGVTYHSIHGAIQESKHVFIKAGLLFLIDQSPDKTFRIFEMGFGTGLNALLSYLEAEKRKLKIYYETIEPFPLKEEKVRSLNYCRQLDRSDLQPIFEQLHFCEWETKIEFSPFFIFKKTTTALLNFKQIDPFNLIFFDAFDPKVQPELWTKEVFE